MGGLCPALAQASSPEAASSAAQNSVTKRLDGQLSQVALLRRVMSAPMSERFSASACTRACMPIMSSEAGMPLPETSPSSSTTRPSPPRRKS